MSNPINALIEYVNSLGDCNQGFEIRYDAPDKKKINIRLKRGKEAYSISGHIWFYGFRMLDGKITTSLIHCNSNLSSGDLSRIVESLIEDCTGKFYRSEFLRNGRSLPDDLEIGVVYE